MPKRQQSIRDFSGGIADGINPRNLKDNQLQVSNNFIADGVGRLSAIPDKREFSSLAHNSIFPDGNSRNIHSWSADMAFEISAQSSSSNLALPAVERISVAKRAGLIFFHTSAFNNVGIYKNLTITNLNDDEIVEDLFMQANTGGTAYTDAIVQGNTVHKLEQIANGHDESQIPEGQVVWRWKTYTNDANRVTYRSDSSNATKLETGSELIFHGLNNNKHVVKKNVDTDFGANVGTYPVWVMEMEFDYWGALSLGFSGNWADGAHQGGEYLKKPNSGSHSYNGTNVSWTNLNNDAPATANLNRKNGAVTFNDSSNEIFGQFDKWKFKLENIHYYKKKTYTITIQVFSNPAQSASTNVILTYTNNYGETAADVIQGLFGGGEEEIESDNYDQENSTVYWSATDDGAYIFQDHRTLKPYGIGNVSYAISNEENTLNALTDGEKYQHLVAIANSNSQASIYTMEGDNWLDWGVDLRIDTSVTTNNKDITFFDVEGDLTLSCMAFRANNMPKWFGYLKVNKTYVDQNLTPASALFSTDFSPKPYQGRVTTGQSAQRTDTYSHMALSRKEGNQLFSPGGAGYLNGDTKLFRANTEDNEVTIVRHSRNYFAPEKTGLRLFYDFFDTGVIGVSNPGVIQAGLFKKDNPVHFYFSYVYKGGYVSKPERFTANSYRANSTYGRFQTGVPKDEECAMSVALVIGKQLIGGDGSGNIINPRLKGIEIWAKYVKTDPSNIYLVTEVDLNKGWRSNITGEWLPLSPYNYGSNYTNTGTLAGYSTGDFSTDGDFQKANYMVFDGPNTIESFRDRYGISYENTIGFTEGGTGWQTACVFNRKAYYGNVRIIGTDDEVVYKPDGILKSSKGMYGTVGIDNLIEATVNDGDEIVSLQVVGNKLCQFKKYSLTIMGVKILENGQSTEFIEQVIHHAGVYNENQICQTPYGLFWVSRSGVYTFDGNQINKLTEKNQGSTLSKEQWETFYGEKTFCGYDAYWNHVLIPRTNVNNNKTLIFSFNTSAFTSSNDILTGLKTSGFAQTREGHILYAQEKIESNTAITGSDSNNPSTQIGNTQNLTVQPNIAD